MGRLMIVFLTGMCLIACVYASVTFVNTNLQTQYYGGQNINGTVFVTLVDQPTSSQLTSNFAGNSTLLSLLRRSNLIHGAHYTCDTPSCEPRYVSHAPTTGLALASPGTMYAGFVIEGTGVSISNARFEIQSNALASCNPQILIDVLADGTDFLTNTRSNGQSCGVRYTGCYNQSNTVEATIIGGKEYCERIELPAFSSLIVGGEIRNGSSSANLTMQLYDLTQGGLAGSCTLPRHTYPLEELRCTIPAVTSHTGQYYLCITSSSSAGYTIGWETQAPTCGTAQGFDTLTSDFDLFAETTQHSSSPSFEINETNYEAQFNLPLHAVLDGYIVDTYQRQCHPEACIIPFSFQGSNQFIQLINPHLEYETVGVPSSTSMLYELSYTDALVSGTNISLQLGNVPFTIPLESSEDTFTLFLDGISILEKPIFITDSFSFGLQPLFIAFGQRAYLTIISNHTIVNATWDFGDGSAPTSATGSSVTHTYTTQNSSLFLVTVTAIDDRGRQAEKQFSIVVGNPKDLANQTIKDYKQRLANLTEHINVQPAWAVSELQNIIGLSELATLLTAAENDYRSALNEEDYRAVMLKLIALEMPRQFTTLRTGTDIPLSAGYKSINPTYLERIDNTDVPDNTLLAETIGAWMDEHFVSELTFHNLGLVTDFDTKVIATLVRISTRPLDSVEEPVYLIFGNDIEHAGIFKSDYAIRSIPAGTVDYTIIDPTAPHVFDFLLRGEFTAETLGAYLAPEVDRLPLERIVSSSCNLNMRCENGETAQTCPEDCSRRWLRFSLIGWVAIAIGFLVAYILLQEWYKKFYQKTLFPDENSLYNLLTFIYVGRRAHLPDEQIRARLLAQGWSSERIGFAFKKIAGKRIGMLEIPLFTRSQHKKTLGTLSQKQGAPIDARFIKRPSFT